MAAAARGGWTGLVVNGTDVYTQVLEPVAGIEPSITGGRAPVGESEIALGRSVLERLGADVGDTVEIDLANYGGSTAKFDVVGEVIVASPLFLILDRIQDPYNLGAILRSAEVFGVNGVVLGEREQCEITPHVARSSAGAVNFLRIARTDDLAALVRSWQGAGVRAVAATADGSLAADEEDFRRPTALLIGNEGTGVGEELL